MLSKKLRVLVLGGGPSSEHEISLKTAEMVYRHLDRKKYEPTLAAIPKKGKWNLPEGADIVFIAMHGEFGEDGQIQKILENAGISFTGSGSYTSALGMDKLKSQAIFASHGLNVPKIIDLKNKFSYPIVIKPADRGSSVGVSIVRGPEELKTAVKKAEAVSKNILAQEFILGAELTCGILDNGKNNLIPLLPTEIVPKKGDFFDFESKYKESGSEEITPARVSEEIIKEAQDIAVKSHVLLECAGFSRTDMILSKKDGKLYVLEINTIPGLTAQSLLPKAAAVCGISFPKLLDHMVMSAVVKKNNTAI